MKWTTEQDDTLRALWGKFRTTTIAGEIGCSKNAVIGRAHRIGLQTLLRMTPGEKRAPRAQREKRVTFRKSAKPVIVPVPVDALNIPFCDLEPQHCRFPTFGEGRTILFCGHTTTDGNSFCGWHCSIAYTKPHAERPAQRYVVRKAMFPARFTLSHVAAA